MTEGFNGYLTLITQELTVTQKKIDCGRLLSSDLHAQELGRYTQHTANTFYSPANVPIHHS
jgi:hypothetical protein